MRAEEPDEVKAWWEEWQKVVSDGHFEPGQIWNIDETGNFLCYGEAKNMVIAPKGIRSVQRPVYEQRKWLTVVGCGSTAGAVLPPTFFFKGGVPADVREARAQFEREQYLLVTTPKGWATKEAWKTFLQWQFVPFTDSETTPQLLLTDGHKSRFDLDTIM